MKKVLAIVLLLFTFGGSAYAFALWDDLDQSTDVTITVGEGVTLTVNPETFSDGNLIPEGAVQKAGDVTEIVITFTLNLDQVVVEELDLAVTVENLLINNDATYAGLVNTVVVSPTTIHNDEVTVTVTVTLSEPADQTEYDAIKNQNITFDVTFLATEKE